MKRAFSCLFAIALLMTFFALCQTAFAEPAATDEPTIYACGDYEYILLDDGTACITRWYSWETDLTVADALDGYVVTAIGDEAFSSCYSLTSITLPDSAVSIGSNIFQYCSSLREIVVPADHPVFTIIDGVLFNKTDKRLVCYPAGLGASSYEVPDGITSIGDYSFYDCRNLTSVTLTDSVVSIGSNPFSRCSSLRNIVVSPDHPALATIDGVLFY
ncbi:MAG: leucine-rich repeat domain-containing protein, partial [Clostridia bacterium]|nr:leucine-rich repeat domain-containing protein [Clostridia bacterium]